MKWRVVIGLFLLLAWCTELSDPKPEWLTGNSTKQAEESSKTSFPPLQERKIWESFNDFTLTSYQEEENSVHFVLEGEKTIKGKLSYDMEFTQGYYFIPDEKQTLDIKIDELAPQREKLGGVEYSIDILEGELAETGLIDSEKEKAMKAGAEFPVELSITKIEHAGYYYSEYHTILSVQALRFLHQ